MRRTCSAVALAGNEESCDEEQEGDAGTNELESEHDEDRLGGQTQGTPWCPAQAYITRALAESRSTSAYHTTAYGANCESNTPRMPLCGAPTG